MAKVTLTKDDALAILDGDKAVGEIVSDVISGTRRWSIVHTVIFKTGGKFLRGSYSRAATENQDGSPWEYNDHPEFEEVEPFERTITDYRPIEVQ